MAKVTAMGMEKDDHGRDAPYMVCLGCQQQMFCTHKDEFAKTGKCEVVDGICKCVKDNCNADCKGKPCRALCLAISIMVIADLIDPEEEIKW